VTAGGSARLIYPALDFVSETRSLVHRLALKRYKPEVVWRRISQALSSILNLQRELPAQLRQIVSKLDKGKLEMRFQLDELEQLVNSLENASSRLTSGIITGAIIMGSSMIITTGVGPHIFGFPALGVVGYILSVLLGLWLIITILRSKR
jgi:ubiquinone biosynthesis protein